MILTISCLWLAAFSLPDLEKARDAQDRQALERAASELARDAAQKNNDATAQYRTALAYSYLSEVALELKDKAGAAKAAEAGIEVANKAVALNGSKSEHHRILGTLCGQIIPANILAGMRYGRCAVDSINKALELDNKSAPAYLSRGIGNFYLPKSFGGGVDLAMNDFRKAISLDPKMADAHLWLGIALRKAGNNREARTALTEAVKLAPTRRWAQEQLEKTPAQ